ncbi:MAG: VWA domain-containing protein [Candidatus Muirbacterium halophilum]|nr:VWA domain-containing protein [Candidatus Muirbacterium halophilum]MCK9476009.1 VWA domain-containing protein [Candidatus Muirbacterium halophilum]
MSFKIAGGSVSFNNLRHTRKSFNNISSSQAKISSGLRINKAGDDAAGLAVSEKMRAQVNGLDQAVSNTEHAINMLQVADGALDTIHAVLQRMRKLSVAAANDSYTTEDRKDIQIELDKLIDNIDDISNGTEYNTKKLINGDCVAKTYTTDRFIGDVKVKGNVKDFALSITVVNSGTRHKISSNKRLEPDMKMKDFGVEGQNTLEISNRVIFIDEEDNVADVMRKINAEETTVEASIYNSRLVLESKLAGTNNLIKFGENSTALSALGLNNDIDSPYSLIPSNTVISILNITDSNKVVSLGRFESNDRLFDKEEFKRLDGTEFDLSNISLQVNNLLARKYEPKEVDIAFIIDITGSMGAEIDTLKTALDDVVTRLKDHNVDPRFAFMAYADDIHIHPRYDFIKDVDEAKNYIQTIRDLVGTPGIGGREDLHHAMDWSIDNFTWLSKEKYVIALTDEDDDYTPITTAEITAKLLENDITFAAVRNPGFGDTDTEIDQVAVDTGGFLLNINSPDYTQFSDNIINELSPETATFKVAVRDATQNFQIGANSEQLADIQFGNMSSESLGLSMTLIDGDSKVSEKIHLLSVETQKNAEKSITFLEDKIKEVSSLRTKIGGFQNMLEKSIDFLQVEMENTMASESQIRDIDMALEMTHMVKNQMLNDSGISVTKFVKSIIENIYAVMK